MRFTPTLTPRNDSPYTWVIRWCLLLSVMATCFPIPSHSLTRRGRGKDLSAPFPCQNRPCGCPSAERCWRTCCCFSMREKLSWARENGVEPPPDVIREAAAERSQAIDPKLVDLPSCHGRDAIGPHHARPAAASSRVTVVSAPGTERERTEDRVRTGFVLGPLVQRCLGNTWYWIALPCSTADRLEPTDLAPKPEGWFAPDHWIWLCDIAHSPPTPPPRALS